MDQKSYSTQRYLEVSEISVGDRIRQDLGDLTGLAASINDVGMLCPIGITTEGVLVYGQRRLEAAKLAGLEEVPVVTISSDEENSEYQRQEITENTERKDFTIEEKIRIVDQAEPVVSAIKERIRKSRIAKDEVGVLKAQRELDAIVSKSVSAGAEKRSILASLVGLGARNLERAREIIHAADQTKLPLLRTIVDVMNQTGNITSAFERYIATLPAAPFADDDESDDDDEDVPFFEREPAAKTEQANPSTSPAPQRSIGEQMNSIIDDSDKFSESNKKPKGKAKAVKAAAEPDPKATKQRGKQRTHAPAYNPSDVRTALEQFVKQQLRKVPKEHQESALQILTGNAVEVGIDPSDEAHDAESALRKIKLIVDGLPTDQLILLLPWLKEIISHHDIELDGDYLPSLGVCHGVALLIVTDEMRERFRGLKEFSDWEQEDRPAKVRQFVKTARRRLLEFERHTGVGVEPNATLFEADADIPPHLDTDDFKEVWGEWWAGRKRRKLSVTAVTKKKQLKLLALGDVEQAIAIVSKADENGWKGIPDDVWMGKHGHWCDRVPAHADIALLKKIGKAPTVASRSPYSSAEERGAATANRRSTFREE